MTEYEIHPAADYYGFPMLEGEDWEQFKADIAKNGQLHAIVLYEGKIAEGRNRYRACKELGIEPVVETYTGKQDIYDFVWSVNFNRRHLTQSQKAAAASLRTNLSQGHRPSTSPIVGDVTVAQAAADAGVAPSQVHYAKRAQKNKAAFKALQQGKLSAKNAADIAALPEEQQAAALEKATSKGFGRKAQGKKNGPQKFHDWTQAEIDKEKRCLAALIAPSTFPADAPLPQSDHHDDVGIREAVDWLRVEEVKIKDYTRAQLDQMLLRTNRIQAYKTNWGKVQRPDLDQRILDWSGDLWRRQQRQHERISIRSEVKKRSRPAHNGSKPSSRKPERAFDERVKAWWIQAESPTTRLFKKTEHAKLRKAFKDLLEGISFEEMGTAVGADAQKSTDN